MSKQLFLAAALLLIPLFVFSQSSNWLSSIDLNLSVNSGDRIDLYTDKDGNHIIVQKSNQLVYYLFSPTGTQIRTSVRDNDVSEYPRLSRIAGWEGKLYIIYKEGNKIKTQKSTDGGANWSTTAVNEITMYSSTSNGMDAWTHANGVHLVYSEYDNSNSNYKTWYQRNAFDQSNWVEQKEVTDEANVSGGFPSVTTSANRVHVAFTAGQEQDPIYNRDITKTRDRYSGTWQSSQQIFNDAARSMVIATSSKLHNFYYDFVAGIGQWHFDLYYRNRSLGSTTWSSPQLLHDFADPDAAAVDIAVTSDDVLHIVSHKEYSEWQDSWSNPYTFTSDLYVHQRIAANSNDIYVIWNNASTIKLRQRDFAPTVPQNLSRSIEDPQGDKHPRIDWDPNPEADIDKYEVWKKKGSGNWNLHATTSNNFYVDNGETGAALFAQPGSITLSYKLKAVDLQNNKSDFSSMVSFHSGSADPPPESIANAGPGAISLTGIPAQFLLLPNYPNPFNPTTTIAFSLSEDGPVELTVYDLTGRKISTLANGYMEAGYHRAVWNGVDQQGKAVGSGVYVYQLKAGDQRFVKKMMLIK